MFTRWSRGRETSHILSPLSRSFSLSLSHPSFPGLPAPVPPLHSRRTRGGNLRRQPDPPAETNAIGHGLAFYPRRGCNFFSLGGLAPPPHTHTHTPHPYPHTSKKECKREKGDGWSEAEARPSPRRPPNLPLNKFLGNFPLLNLQVGKVPPIIVKGMNLENAINLRSQALSGPR